MTLLLVVLFVLTFESAAQSDIQFDLNGISMATYQQPGQDMESQLKTIARSHIPKTQVQTSFNAPDIKWESGYDHSSTLGFFCKFEDLLSNKAKFKFNLGLTD